VVEAGRRGALAFRTNDADEEQLMDLRGRRAAPIGAYRRGVRLVAEEGRVSAEMEDDVHNFAVILEHDGERVTGVRAEGRRTPWTACDGAVTELGRLKGLRLDEIPAMSPAGRAEHCLHMFDLAMLAATRARQPGFSRLYLIEVDHGGEGSPLATLSQDGEALLAWRIRGGVIEGSRFDGLSLAELPRRLGGLTPDEREAALVLRRASSISFVRSLDLDAYDYANELRKADPSPTCYAQQLRRRDEARRHKGSARDFWADQRWPLEG
jgi:hypothetical protein